MRFMPPSRRVLALGFPPVLAVLRWLDCLLVPPVGPLPFEFLHLFVRQRSVPRFTHLGTPRLEGGG